MTQRKFPPKGYKNVEHPMPHNFSYNFGLTLEDETKNSTICTLIRQDLEAATPETRVVNPAHASFGEETGATIHRGSIVPRLTLQLNMSLTKAAIETDKVRNLIVNYVPIYTAFLEPLEAVDEVSGADIESTLELAHDTTDKSVRPLFSTVNLLDGGLQPVNSVSHTEVFGDYGLATDLVLESVAFDKELFYDTMQYFGHGGMLKRLVGSMRSIVIGRDRPYRFFSRNYTNPTVKRGNQYTFCGILFHLPQAGSPDQLMRAGDTTPINHLNVSMNVRYDEWNNEFLQFV